ncbi:MAG TPA: hypothetical protein PLO27_06295, partial [Marmoricola sp.]|nr:hypothetical protein [Marmoricola sp.]
MTLESELRDLRGLVTQEDAANWRILVRDKLKSVQRALRATGAELPVDEAWLSARESANDRVRARLEARTAALSQTILSRLDNARISLDLRRLMADLEHYVQRVHDMNLDAV